VFEVSGLGGVVSSVVERSDLVTPASVEGLVSVVAESVVVEEGSSKGKKGQYRVGIMKRRFPRDVIVLAAQEDWSSVGLRALRGLPSILPLS